MSSSSILGGSAAPARASGKNVDLLGPSDTSDSGSDVQGERSMATAPDSPDEWGALVTGTGNDSDATGTGERASAGGDDPVRDGADILPDHVIDDGTDPEASLEFSDEEDLPDAAADIEAEGIDTDAEDEDQDEDSERPRGAR